MSNSFYFIKCVHIQLQVIVAVPSNSTWCTPGIFVPKANGEVCIMLISSAKQDHKEGLYTVPRVDRLLAAEVSYREYRILPTLVGSG